MWKFDDYYLTGYNCFGASINQKVVTPTNGESYTDIIKWYVERKYPFGSRGVGLFRPIVLRIKDINKIDKKNLQDVLIIKDRYA